MGCFLNLILLFMGCGLSCCSQCPARRYFYINKPMNWYDARTYCREHYTDLATLGSPDDNVQKANFSYTWAWIGLHDDPNSWKYAMGVDANSWRWSATGGTSKTAFQNWSPGEPNDNTASERCVSMADFGLWNDINCDLQLDFVCSKVNRQNDISYTYIPLAKTWLSAQEYCRTHYTDLPVIEDRAANDRVYSVKPLLADVWIGLYRVPWMWSDMTQSSYTAWKPGEPNNANSNQFCVYETQFHVWNDAPCAELCPIICHQVVKPRFKTVTMKMTFLSHGDLTDPSVRAQILAQLNARLTSQGLTGVTLRWKSPPRKVKK